MGARRRIGILAFGGFEDTELAAPAARFEAEGHEVVVIGPRRAQALHGRQGRRDATTDAGFGEVDPDSLDALLIPGDERPERLRSSAGARELVRRFRRTGRPIAAIEEGIELLRAAGLLEGATVTSAPAFRYHLQDAGARWVDRELVVDGSLVTAGSRSHLAALCAALEEMLEDGPHGGPASARTPERAAPGRGEP